MAVQAGDCSMKAHKPFQYSGNVAPIAVFLEHDGILVIKQATATVIYVPPDEEEAEQDKVDQEGMTTKEAGSTKGKAKMRNAMRQMAIFPASSIKVPVPGLKSTFYRVRAVVMFAEDKSMGRLVNSWSMGRRPSAGASSDTFLVEGRHYQVCPGYNFAKRERNHTNFAVIPLLPRTPFRQPEPGQAFGDLIRCAKVSVPSGRKMAKADYDAFALKMSTVQYYRIEGYKRVNVMDGMTWDNHEKALADGDHPLYERQRLVVCLEARHFWERQDDQNSWKLPEEDRQYEKPTKRVLPTFNVFWQNCRMLFKRGQRNAQKFRWTTLPVLLRTPIPVDWDLLLAQGLEATSPSSNKAISGLTMGMLKCGAMNGGPWFLGGADDEELIGMHLGGPSLGSPGLEWLPSSTEGAGGLYVALAVQHRFVNIVSPLFNVLYEEYTAGLSKERKRIQSGSKEAGSTNSSQEVASKRERKSRASASAGSSIVI